MNYSVIAAIGSSQFYGFKVIRGGVKAPDYCLFLLEILCGYNYF
jgi:hypothetical protein